MSDLDSCINIETYNKLQLMTADGKPEIIRCNSNGIGIIHSVFSGLPVRTAAASLNLPSYPPKQVKELEIYKGTSTMKVSVRGRIMCCEVADNWAHFAID